MGVSDIKVERHIDTKRVIQCQNRCKLPYESKRSPLEECYGQTTFRSRRDMFLSTSRHFCSFGVDAIYRFSLRLRPGLLFEKWHSCRHKSGAE